MGVKFFTIFFLFFISSSIFLFYQKSKRLSIYVDPKKVPIVELKDSSIYDITYNGIESYLYSQIAKRYIDRYEFFDVITNSNKDGKSDRLRAKMATLKGDILTLKDNVFFRSSNNRTLKSDIVIYNLKKDILSSNKKFIYTYKNSSVRGDSFVYYKKEKRLLAKNIFAKIDLGDKR